MVVSLRNAVPCSEGVLIIDLERILHITKTSLRSAQQLSVPFEVADVVHVFVLIYVMCNLTQGNAFYFQCNVLIVNF